MKKIMCVLLSVIAASVLAACGLRQDGQASSTEDGREENTVPYDSVFPQHEPYGEGIGAMPGRVVWDYNTDCVLWDGEGFWWRPENFDESVIPVSYTHLRAHET